MRVDEEILFTCDVCQAHDLVRFENLLDYQCKNCDTPALVIKHDMHERVLKEIDATLEHLDNVIGSAMYGFMSPKEARDWLEHNANNISDTLNKAREYIKEMQKEKSYWMKQSMANKYLHKSEH